MSKFAVVAMSVRSNPDYWINAFDLDYEDAKYYLESLVGSFLEVSSAEGARDLFGTETSIDSATEFFGIKTPEEPGARYSAVYVYLVQQNGVDDTIPFSEAEGEGVFLHSFAEFVDAQRLAVEWRAIELPHWLITEMVKDPRKESLVKYLGRELEEWPNASLRSLILGACAHV